MISLLLETIALVFASWAGWMYIKQYIFKVPLENIPGPPSSFLLGNLPQLFHLNGWQFHKDIAARYGSVIRIKAFLGESYLYIFDPMAMHHLLVKDQHTYDPATAEGSLLIFGEGVGGVLGDRHRKQRKMLNPVFSVAHLRDMVPIFWDVSRKLRDTLHSKVEKGAQEIDMANWMARMALELVGQSGLGYSFDPLTEDGRPHPYCPAVKQLVPVLGRLATASLILTKLSRFGSQRLRRWLVDIVPYPDLHELRDITDIMHSTSIEILETKRKALEKGDDAVERQVAGGKDIMSILLKANMNASDDDRLPESEVLAQMSSLIFAAMDTTSNALSRILHLLSIHQDVQEKVRYEITEALAGHGDLAYDGIVSLPYLDAICRETLRLYPPVSQIARIPNQDAVLSVSHPLKGVDGSEIREIYVPKGTMVFISILSANTNPETWGNDSFEWKPERWLKPLPESVKSARSPGIYSNMMTFSGGGRACIGFKFSQLEMKVVLATLLKSFRFSLSDKNIFWVMNGISTPAVVGNLSEVSLPLKVSLV